MSEFYSFLKKNKSKLKLKAGYGVTWSKTFRKGFFNPFLSIKFLDTKLIDAAFALTAKNEFGIQLGIKVKKDLMTLNLGVFTELKKEMDKKQELRPSIGISFNL